MSGKNQFNERRRAPKVAGFYWLHFADVLGSCRMMKVWYDDPKKSAAGAGWVAEDCSEGEGILPVTDWSRRGSQAQSRRSWEGPLGPVGAPRTHPVYILFNTDRADNEARIRGLTDDKEAAERWASHYGNHYEEVPLNGPEIQWALKPKS